MKFQDKLKKRTKEQVWQEYCGFLDLSLPEYMYIQRRLMEEQLRLWRDSGLGKLLLNGAYPETIDQLREQMPLTRYDDYAETLLSRRVDMLPTEPIIWIQTTWEGGLRPIKLAPYTRSMLDCYKRNIIAAQMLSTGRSHGDFRVKKGDRFLYGGAPLPYATGLMPSLFSEDIDFVWLPDPNKHTDMSFEQRIKYGFSMALSGGLDCMFGIGSVANYITENFGKSAGSTNLGSISITTALRYLKAKYVCHRDGRQMQPADLFRIKGFVCTGTDAARYKEKLSKAWGVVPTDLAAGTEATCIATGDWQQRGMVFFPNACFYEFIPEEDMKRNLQDPSYVPRTCLMDEVQFGENYELVISVLHGGAFMRYRIGDVYHCVSARIGELPRFSFLDRVPSVIDIAGFTRITEASVNEVIRLSKLRIGDWVAKKEFDENGTPFLHMYLEMGNDMPQSEILKKQVLMEHFTVYFKYFDSDYHDLKKLLGLEPLQLTILKTGTFEEYRRRYKDPLPKINASALDLSRLVKLQTTFRTDIKEERSS